MTDHKTATREQWLAARLELLEAEKEFTRRRDELTRRRMAMPWERVEKSYRFELSRQQWLKANAHFLAREKRAAARMTHPHRPSSSGTSRTAGHFYPDLNQGDSDD